MAYRRTSGRSRSSSGRGRSASGRSQYGRRTASRTRRRTASSGSRTVRLVIEQQPVQALARPDGMFQVAMAAPKRSTF